MLGPSRSAAATAREALVARADDPAFGSLSEELLAVSVLLERESRLRATLADAGQPAEAKKALVMRLLGGRVSDLAVAVVAEVATARWSSARDLVDGIEGLAAEATFVVAERAGRLDGVEEELFRFARTVEAQPDLLAVLTDPAVDATARAALIDDLLAGRASAETARLVRHVVAHPRGRRVEAALGDLVEQAARRRERLLAEVTVATPMTEDQQRRLADALGRIYGRPVSLQVEVDAGVLGGVVVQVGDEVIDGSIAHRLAEVSRRLAG